MRSEVKDVADVANLMSCIIPAAQTLEIVGNGPPGLSMFAVKTCATLISELEALANDIESGLPVLSPPIQSDVTLLVAALRRHIQGMNASFKLFKTMQAEAGQPLPPIDSIGPTNTEPLLRESYLRNVSIRAAEMLLELGDRCNGLVDRLRAFGAVGVPVEQAAGADWHSVTEAAHLTGWTSPSITTMANAGKIAAVGSGKQRRVDVNSIPRHHERR